MGWRHDLNSSGSRRTGTVTDFCGIQLKRLSSCGGFSFIEVMIVMGRTEDAKRAAAKAQISNIDSALQLYKLDNGNIPTTEQGLKALVERPASGPAAPNWKAGGYLPKVPVDPWGGPYKYTTPSTQGGEFEIVWRREKRRHRKLGSRSQLILMPFPSL